MKTNEEILELSHFQISYQNRCGDVLRAMELAQDEIRCNVLRAMELAQAEIRKEYEEKIRKAVAIAKMYTYSRDVCQESNWDLTKLKVPRGEIQFNNAKIIEALNGWQYYHEGE